MSLTQRFDQWAAIAPPHLFGDPIWRLPAYRIGLFLSIVAREDVVALRGPGTHHASAQLLRAIDSISANIAEGYSRYGGRDRARYFEIAQGSAREAREWYQRIVPGFPLDDALERAALLTRIVKILNVAIPAERNGASERRIRAKGRSTG